MNEFNETAFAVEWYMLLDLAKGYTYFRKNQQLIIIDSYPSKIYNHLQGVKFSADIDSTDENNIKMMFIIHNEQFKIDKVRK